MPQLREASTKQGVQWTPGKPAWVRAAFSPRKAYMTFYVGDKFEGAEELYAKLGKHKKSLVCLYINKLDNVALDVLREIIAREYGSVSTSK
jgi:hypothetical protein